VTELPSPAGEQRVFVLVPTGRDAALTVSVLERAGIRATCYDDLARLCADLTEDTAGVLIAEEAVGEKQAGVLLEWLGAQPAWSDLPVLVLSRSGADSAAVAHAMERLGNVTVLERPTRVAALVSAVRSAIRARRRQYQVRDHLLERDRGREAQLLLAAIVASSDDAIISKTLNGDILTWNKGAERLFGYTAKEVIGKPITILIPPERQHEEPELLRRLRNGESIEHFETVRVAKDGRRMDISLTVSPIIDGDGRIIGASKVARDITQQKRAAEALRDANEQLRVVTDNMAVAVTRCDRDFRYLWVSRGFAAWMGRAVDEIVGRTIPEVMGVVAFETVRPHITQVLSGEPVDFETQVPYRDLGARWIRAGYVPTHDAAGETDGWVAVITDTTEQRKMEDALRQADRRKDEFLAVLAHELRNPLAPIRSALHVLRMTNKRDPTTERVGEIMERQVNHIVRLVDDLLEVSRITTGKIELRKEPVEIASVVRTAIEASRPLIEGGGHHLAVVIPPEPITLDADPVRLAQVLANLLNNAAKYTDTGGQIWLTVRRDADSVAISVRDTGSGIPRDMLARVFELFTQVDRRSNRAQGGLGIGLTLVKSLIELHGGSIRAYSEGLGRGSEFVARLPIRRGVRPAHAAAEVPAPSPVLADRRVLVVDDNIDAAESLGILLKLLGADVKIVHNGPDALAALPVHHPAVVLLDIGMRGMDGYEVARRIRRQHEYQDLTLIALTGWGQDEDRRKSQAAGFDYHLIKPADLVMLQTLLVSLEGRQTAHRRTS